MVTNFLLKSSMPSVLSKLSTLVDGEDIVQLKILQALVTLITTTVDLHDDNLAQVSVNIDDYMHCYIFILLAGISNIVSPAFK